MIFDTRERPNLEVTVNNRNTPFELNESPGFLLQELGLKSLYLYRPRKREWKILPPTYLDEEIWDNGEAMVFRRAPDCMPVIIRLGYEVAFSLLCHQSSSFALLTVWPDYVGEGQKFLVSLREEEQLGTHWPVSVLAGLKLLPCGESDRVIPC